ncbi:MAG: hypothetical protein ACTSPM_00350 [Candidatus Heimdallarchaeota archaeon]
MRKKTMIGILSILLCILILPTSPIRGAIFTLDDPTADLLYYNNSTEGNPGPNVHPEIDIVSLQINGDEIAVTFVAPPKNDGYYEYSFRIYWIGDDFLGNWTKCTWGYLSNNKSYNRVHTFIETSTGVELVDAYEYDVVSVVGSSLIIPLFNKTLITHMFDPHIVKVHVQFNVVFMEEFYSDNIDYATGTMPFPGFTLWSTLGGISLIVMIGLLVKKKKN